MDTTQIKNVLWFLINSHEELSLHTVCDGLPKGLIKLKSPANCALTTRKHRKGTIVHIGSYSKKK